VPFARGQQVIGEILRTKYCLPDQRRDRVTSGP
jgi:hypothetical protein